MCRVGEQVRICATCGERDTQEIAKKEHVHVYITSVVTAPTCTEQGYTTHTCACGETKVDTYVDALGHAWTEWVTTKEATKEADGEQTRECERCDATETRAVAFEAVPVTSITLAQTEAKLKTGATLQLTATVSEDGLVTAVKAGKVEITVTANDDSNVSAVCVITITKPAANKPSTQSTPVVSETPLVSGVDENNNGKTFVSAILAFFKKLFKNKS